MVDLKKEVDVVLKISTASGWSINSYRPTFMAIAPEEYSSESIADAFRVHWEVDYDVDTDHYVVWIENYDDNDSGSSGNDVSVHVKIYSLDI